jgi:hypothetical protein
VTNIKIGLKEDEVTWTGLIWLRIGASAGSCKRKAMNFQVP